MVESRAAHDDVRYLTGSPQRGAILAELCGEPCRPTELSDRIDGSRTTVQRVLSGFLERGWVRKRDGEYVATITGRRVDERFRRLKDEVDLAAKLAPVAAHLDGLAEELPEGALGSADVTVATERRPLAAVDAFADWLRAGVGEELRLLAPVPAETFDDVTGEVVAGGGSVEIVLDETAFAESGFGCERDAVDGGVPSALELRVATEPIATGLAIREDRVAVGVHDDENNFVALLTTDDSATLAWAQTRYKAVRDRSRPLRDLVEPGE